MFRKCLIICLFVLIGLTMTLNAFADVDSNGVSIFMTLLNSTTPKNFFAASETPYVYFGFPSSFDSWLKLNTSSWHNPLGGFAGLTLDATFGNSGWYKISNWDTVKTAGLWTVDAGYLGLNLFGPGMKSGSQGLNFTFAPEPISSALFLLGGGALALKRYRKKA